MFEKLQRLGGHTRTIYVNELSKKISVDTGFIVFNEEQSITAGGDWTTKIGGKMTILND